MEGVDWSSAEAIGRLRIGDFACGTGALLSAVYEQIAARHERAGGNAVALHRVVMEEALYGCDVMPSAVHITGSTLSGVEPSVLFNGSHLYTMPYGRMKDGSVMIGSLELLQSSNVPLTVGEEPAGETITAPRGENGESWGAVRLADYSLAQAAYCLSQSKLWLSGSASSVHLKTATLGDVGKLGLVDRDITGPAPRGPFDKVASSPTATYLALWNHNAKKETRMVCLPDSQLLVRPGMEDKAADVWATSSRTHFNRDFTFGSQALACWQPAKVAHFETREIMGWMEVWRAP